MICTICYNSKIQNISTPNCCDHVFCYKCLKKWHTIDSNSDFIARCPICRKYFNGIKKLTKYSYAPRITRSKTREYRANYIKNRCSFLINQIKDICDGGDQKKINTIVYDQSIPEILNLFYNNKWFLLEIEKISEHNESFINTLYAKLDEFEELGFSESKIWKWKFKELFK